MFSAVLLSLLSAARTPVVRPANVPREVCLGAYADSHVALADRVRDYERTASYAWLFRTEVVYETPFYGADGRMQQKRTKASFNGTGFAYLRRGEELFFLTNNHVVTMPNVTTNDARVEDVPVGSKKLSEESWIVERDGDEVRQLYKLTKVVADPASDAAVMKARVNGKSIEVMPYKIGRSADLRVGNYVYVRGYPLGVFQAVNVGRVTNPNDNDTESVWNHQDFIVDALLSQGHSGSPVFAISCKSGALELVGMYHAGYKAGSALNAVVAVDDLRELMEQMRVPKRAPKAEQRMLTRQTRESFLRDLRSAQPPVFPFAGVVGSVSASKEELLFTIYDKDFDRRLWITDKAEDEFGDTTKIGFKNAAGAEVTLSAEDFDAGVKGSVDAVYRAIVQQVLDAVARRKDKKIDLSKGKAAQRDLLDVALDDIERLAEAMTEQTPPVTSAVP